MSKSRSRRIKAASEAERLLIMMVSERAILRRLPKDAALLHLHGQNRKFPLKLAEELIRRDLAIWASGDMLAPTDAGRAWVSRHMAPDDSFRRQHARRERATVKVGQQQHKVEVNAAESPLAWLRRRRDKAGRPLLGDAAFAAGERLRMDFTYANLTPRVTASWEGVPGPRVGRGGGEAHMADTVLAARQRVQRALAAVGPELSGVMLDVSCFLKGLEDIESERGWPPRSAKVVLHLALDRLARHYGFGDAAHGAYRPGRILSWGADGEKAKSCVG